MSLSVIQLLSVVKTRSVQEMVSVISHARRVISVHRVRSASSENAGSPVERVSLRSYTLDLSKVSSIETLTYN